MNNFDLKKYLSEGKLLKEELKAPSGWTEIKDLSDMHSSTVKAWEAPMEGWDEENKDIIVVRKEDDKFYLDGYIPFGSFDEQGPFDTYEEALKLAVEEMEEFKKAWDEDLAEGKLLKDKEPRDGVKSAAAKLGIKPKHVKEVSSREGFRIEGLLNQQLKAKFLNYFEELYYDLVEEDPFRAEDVVDHLSIEMLKHLDVLK